MTKVLFGLELPQEHPSLSQPPHPTPSRSAQRNDSSPTFCYGADQGLPCSCPSAFGL